MFSDQLVIAKRYRLFYLVGLIIIWGLKYYYSKAGINELEWILVPTIGWIKLLSGITFTLDPQLGYINNHFQFIIAPACSGVQFMLITFAVLFYPFVHRMGTVRQSCCWMALSLGASYLLTIFVNSLRIIFSVYILFALPRPALNCSWMTPERVHLAIGVSLYFTSLFVIYRIGEYAARKIARMHWDRSFKPRVYQYLPPLFCYFAVTLAVPLLNGAYQNSGEKFTAYAISIMVICLTLAGLFYLTSALGKRCGGYYADRFNKTK